MGLTGIDPNSPTPAILREFFFAQGESAAPSDERDVIMYGNKTAAGSETVDTLGEFIVDESDMIARFGLRSELFAMYRAFTLVPQSATVYAVAVTEGSGSAAAVTFTVGGAVGIGGAIEFKASGQTFQVPILDSDADVNAIASRVAADINSADSGRLMCTAVAALAVVTVTFSHQGERGDLMLGVDNTVGFRQKIIGTTAVTVVKGALVAGVGAEDNTAALAAADAGEFYYQISAAHDVAATTTTDGQVGEACQKIIVDIQPSNGKQEVMHHGLVGTQAEATAVGQSVNSAVCFFWHAEDSDWIPGQIAAHHCAVQRSKELAHPGANIAGYINSDNTPYFMPPAAHAGLVPSRTEVDADLNSGVSAINFQGTGRKAFIVRCVTSRSQNSSGNADYRTREGHIPSVIFYAWITARQRYEEQKQPFAAEDPKDNEPPLRATTTPDSIRAIFLSVVNDFIKGNPLGRFEGAILDSSPAAVAKMKKSISVNLVGGGFSGSVDWAPVIHNLHLQMKIRQIGAAY